MRFKKKTAVVDAFRIGKDETPDWFMDKVATDEITVHDAKENGAVACEITSIDGVRTAMWGEYIVRGMSGEVYPCTAEVFESLYEAA